MEFLEMQLGAVALVLAETIMRELRAKVSHQTVARDLRDDARGRDAQAQAVAIDDCGLRKRKRKDRQAIDQDMVGRNAQSCEGDAHRLVRRAQDVDAIDLDRVDNPDRPDDLGMIRQIAVNFFPQLRGELFRIVQCAVPESLGQNRSRRDYGAGERAPAGFIDSGDAGCA